MAKPIGMRAHAGTVGKLAFDNLAIVSDEPSTPSTDVESPRIASKSWEKYAIAGEKKTGKSRKVAKCFGIVCMMVVLFSLTAFLVIKEKYELKRLHDFEESQHHHNSTTSNITTAITAATTSQPNQHQTKLPTYSIHDGK